MAIRDKITGLTPKQEAFCVELVISSDDNASAAYRKVYSAKMSAGSVHVKACELLRMQKIRARIAALRANAVRKQELSIDRVLEEVRHSAFLDPLSIYDVNGNVLPLKDIPEATRRAIASLVIQKDGTIKIKFCDKMQALERLMRFLGMFEKDNSQRFGFLDDLPRDMLKEIEECLLEIARTRSAEDAAGGSGGGLTH
jgi:hypothetical protein